MVADISGSLEDIKRHDYLPFGEEVSAGVGGRTTNQGYTQPSGIRQGFTGYEKDGETGLNFAQRRYYSPTMGRFTSPDQPLVDQWQSNPQSWNLYGYVRNNPLNLVDPFGMAAECPRGWEGCIERDGKFYWPHPETGEETEIDDSVIVIDITDSGVPRDGGGSNLTVGEAIQQQEERRNSFIVNNVLSGIGYGIGKVFKGIGGLFRRSSKTPLAPALNLAAGTKQLVNPNALRAGEQQTLDPARLNSIRDWLNRGGTLKGLEASEKVVVNTEGVIVRGHHRAYVAAERGLSIEVEVVSIPMKAGSPVTQLPLRR